MLYMVKRRLLGIEIFFLILFFSPKRFSLIPPWVREDMIVIWKLKTYCSLIDLDQLL